MTHKQFKDELSYILSLLPNKLRTALEYEIMFNKNMVINKDKLSILIRNIDDRDLGDFIDNFMFWDDSVSLPDNYDGDDAYMFWSDFSNTLYRYGHLSLHKQGTKIMNYIWDNRRDVYIHWKKLEMNGDKEILRYNIKKLKDVINS